MEDEAKARDGLADRKADVKQMWLKPFPDQRIFGQTNHQQMLQYRKTRQCERKACIALIDCPDTQRLSTKANGKLQGTHSSMPLTE